MISGTIVISDIEYEKCFRSLFPALVRKIDAMENPGTAFRFMTKMGDDLLPVMLKIMDHISNEEKEKLLLGMIDLFQEPICTSLNRFLSNQEAGRGIRIGRIGALKEEGGENLFLVITGVSIDYGLLVKTNLVNQNIDAYMDNLTRWKWLGESSFLKGTAKLALRAGAKIVPEEMERKGMELLNRPDIKKRVMCLIPEGLEKAGLYLTVQDFSLKEDTVKEEPDTVRIEEDSKAGFKLPEEMEEILLNGVVAYLKATVAG